MARTLCLDELRLAYPGLGFAVYAMEPGGAVTLEVFGLDGQVYPFTGATEREAWLTAFPDFEATPATAPEPDTTTPTTNVFD